MGLWSVESRTHLERRRGEGILIVAPIHWWSQVVLLTEQGSNIKERLTSTRFHAYAHHVKKHKSN